MEKKSLSIFGMSFKANWEYRNGEHPRTSHDKTLAVLLFFFFGYHILYGKVVIVSASFLLRGGLR
jgi:hypothetical protein